MVKKTTEKIAEYKQTQEQPPLFRRTVGMKETFGFILWEASRDFPHRPNEEWHDRILAVSRLQRALWSLPLTAWDVINDVFLATFAEKVRTRFGKFRPWLLLYPIYGEPMQLLLLLLPYFFWDTGGDYMPKVLSWVLISVLSDLTGTIGHIATVGMMANITADPQERVSLITKAKLLSIGTNLPDLIFRVVRDVISRNMQLTPMQANESLRRIFTVFGITTITVASAMALFFAWVTRERVVGSDAVKNKPPSVRESLQALKGNRPLLMLMLFDILDRIGINNMSGIYHNAILNFANFNTVKGLPGAIISPISYSYVGKLRERFSTKTLWIASRNIHRPILMAIYFFGMIPARPTRSPGGRYYYNRMYARLWPMMGVWAISDSVWMSLWGTAQVIPEEIRNEVIDYGEWNSGFRSEAMVGTLRGVPQKIAGAIGGFINNIIAELIGFQIGEDYLNQPPRTADRIFLMSTLAPHAFSLLALIPMFFYNINQKDRERMYIDLAKRRREVMEMTKKLNREIETQYEQRDEYE